MKNILKTKLTLVALSIILASCGGGGSNGYYEDNKSQTPVDEETKLSTSQLDSLRIDLDKNSLAVVNDSIVVNVKALSINKGGIKSLPVTLKIIDPTNLVINQGLDTVSTDESGNAQFTLSTLNSSEISNLVKDGFFIEAFVKSSNVSQRIHVNVSGTNSGFIDEKNIVAMNASKNTVNVRDDKSTITVKVTNQNGEILKDQKVSLRVEDTGKNGVYLTNINSLTDENGDATFDLIINESLRKNMTAAELVNAGINLTAIVTGTNGQVTTQNYKINVVQASVPVADGTIVIAYNPINVISYDSNEGNFYAKEAVVTVTDKDGKPLANQNVTMKILPTYYRFGQYVWGATIAEDVDSPTWLHPANYPTYYDRKYFTLGQDKDGEEVKVYTPQSNPSTACNVGNKTTVNGKSLQVATLVGLENIGSTLIYKTDSQGKFNLQVRYPKIYANWLGIQLTATTTTGSKSIETYENIPLNTSTDDFSSDGTWGPNLTSPFGSKGNCS
ncbi:hypothetical protein G9F31_14600 [Acinetobacter sp. 187]|uniref:hypothetical protein n=1 Tax=Acinetobacter lanii TaxID=2715163 RepID=UPI0014085ED6|nr:hypothetical protein [Acinetobacter lanii]NHC04972.1 hypothetical protein [Acinetobacter lanii]